MVPGAAGTTINRVRVRNAGRDALAARLGADRLLSHAATSDVIPRAAILCVKRLADPRPGTVRLAAVHPPSHWIEAVNDAVASLARRAVRPARDPVAGDPDAILFDDRADLLACLVTDWANGVASRRWWWRALVGDVQAIDAVLRVWLERPAYIAAALERVARLGAVPICLQSLSRADAQRLTAAVISAHGLSQLADALEPLPADAPPDTDDVHRARQGANNNGSAGWPRVPAPDVRPPWAHVAPEAVAPHLPLEHQVLAGITLTLRRAPTLARSDAFAAAVRAWQSPSPTRTAARPAEAVSSQLHPPDGQLVSHVIDAIAEPLTEDVRLPARSIIPVNPPLPVAPPASGVSSHTPRLDHLTAAVSTPALESFVVRTEFGGIFYLLNVATAMGYYGDFTEPRRTSLSLSIWDFVAFIGRELEPSVEDDPAWPLLAMLAGRHDDEQPGAGVAPPDDAPSWEEWLAPPVRERLRLALPPTDDASLGRLIVCHHASVRVTSTHVDVHFALAELPIAIRMSGLDRNPGWIPAADRVVTFQFE